MSPSAARLLAELETLRAEFGREAARRRLELLDRLEGRSLSSAGQVLRLHELLCFLRAHPDDERVAGRVAALLESFGERADVGRFRRRLADTGIAGTDIHYRFYWVTARWLARRWPAALTIDWPEFDHRDRLAEILDLLLPYSETPALDMVDRGPEEWLQALKGPGETDAAFLLRRFEALDAGPRVRERIFEQLDVPIRLAPRPGGPARTHAVWGRAPVVFQRRPLDRRRPDLGRESRRRPRAVRELTPARGRELIDLAREAMVTRSRDLDAFAYADPRDARLVEFEGGLAFAALGLQPDRRLLLESSYGFLTLKNGVPIGYALASSLFRSTEVAYNVFETFRGGEAALVFARLLAMVRHLFGSDTFAIDPYQLGSGNEEGLRSGAWWFYYKLGFRPRNPGVRAVLRGELRKMRADPDHRSDLATLEELASDYLFLHLAEPRRRVLGAVALGEIGLRVSAHLAALHGADRERSERVCSREAMQRLGLRSLAGLSPAERVAWRRWAPLVVLLPGVEGWSGAARRSLVRVVRAKGGRRESEFVRRFNRHPELAGALLRLAGDRGTG